MAKIPKDHLDTYFDYGVDIPNRRVFLLDDIEEEGIGAAIKGLYLMEAEDSTKRIELFISSFGGSEYEMWALFDVTRSLKSPIHTVAIGKCMSAAPLLVAAGQPGHRWAMPNTFFMVHETSEDLDGRIDAIARDLRHTQQMGKRWYDEMSRLTGTSAAVWKRAVGKPGDWYFDAAKAMSLGIIDHIWSEKDAE